MISNLSAKIWILVIKHIDYSVMYLKLRNFGLQALYAPYKYSAKIWQREGKYTPKNREKAVIRKSNHNIRFSGAQNWAKIPNFISYYFVWVTFAQKFELWHLVTNFHDFWGISEIMGQHVPKKWLWKGRGLSNWLGILSRL